MKHLKHQRAWGLALIAAALSGCAAQAHRPTIDPAQSYVDQQMSGALGSIDRSLKTLLMLERGGEGARSTGPIGSTVAGAVGPARPVETVRPAAPTTDASARKALDARAKIDWQGPATELLAGLAKNVGYTYRVQGSAPSSALNVRIQTPGSTVFDVLGQVARQIDTRADVQVRTTDRTITLVYK